MNIREACAASELLSQATPASMAALVSCGTLRKYKKGEHLFLERSEVCTLYLLVDGVAALYRLNHRQERRVLFICGPGDFINEVILQDEMASASCEILRDAYVLQFSKAAFLSVMEQDFRLAKAVMDSMALKIRRLYHQMKNTSNSVRLDKQVAAKLWKLSRDFGKECGEGTAISFDISIAFLADMVGSKRETVSRQVKLLSERGLVKVCNGRLVICDREKLLNYFHEA